MIPTTVPEKLGQARGAFNAKSVVVTLLFNEVNTFVVPTIKAEETVKLIAVVVPVNAGLIEAAFYLVRRQYILYYTN